MAYTPLAHLFCWIANRHERGSYSVTITQVSDLNRLCRHLPMQKDRGLAFHTISNRAILRLFERPCRSLMKKGSTIALAHAISCPNVPWHTILRFSVKSSCVLQYRTNVSSAHEPRITSSSDTATIEHSPDVFFSHDMLQRRAGDFDCFTDRFLKTASLSS